MNRPWEPCDATKQTKNKKQDRLCPLCRQPFIKRSEFDPNVPHTSTCLFERGINDYLSGNSQYPSFFLKGVEQLLASFTALEVKNMVIRMFDATSLYNLRDPTVEEEEKSAVPFTMESYEGFSEWIHYTYEEKKGYDWFKLLKHIHDLKFEHRVELQEIERELTDATEKCVDILKDIESAKRAQKGADTAVQSITKAILNCSSDEKKIQLQVKLEAKTKEGEEVKEVIEKLTLREEYTRMTKAQSTYDEFLKRTGIGEALRVVDEWRSLMRIAQPHDNLGQAFEDTSEYFVREFNVKQQNLTNQITTIKNTVQPHDNLGSAFEDTSEYFVREIAHNIEKENGLPLESLVVIHSLLFDGLTVPDKSTGEFDFCICKVLEEYDDGVKHLEVLKIIECKNNAISVVGDIKKKIDSMLFFCGKIENTKSKKFDTATFKSNGVTYKFDIQSFKNLEDEKIFENLFYFTRPGFLLQSNFYDLFYQGMLTITNFRFMSEEFIGKMYQDMKDVCFLASLSPSEAMKKIEADGGMNYDKATSVEATTKLLQKKAIRIFEPIVSLVDLGLPDEEPPNPFSLG